MVGATDVIIIGIRAVLDISIVAFLIYTILKLSYDPRIIGVIIFFTAIFSVNVISTLLGLGTTSYLTDKIAEYAIIIIIILFQPEMRRVILGTRLKIFERQTDKKVLEEIEKACQTLSKRKEGAIIVIEGAVDLISLVQGGRRIDAEVSSDLLVSIFNKNSPTHDGAVIIRGNRIHLVSAILPISTKPLDTNLGTRHKAAVGITEETDALSIVISESGKVSISYAGELYQDITPERLTEKISKITEKESKKHRQ